MAHDLTLLIRRATPRAAARPASIGAPFAPAILDRDVARRLGRSPAKHARWSIDPDLRDAAMAFALTFTGAMIFLM